MKKTVTVILTIIMILLAGLIAAKAQSASTASQAGLPVPKNGMTSTNTATFRISLLQQ